MACRDANSPQAKYQKEKRDWYLAKFGQPTDGPDQTFWDACDRAETMLADGLKKLGKPASLDKLVKLSGAKAADIPLLLQGNVYPLATDQAVLLGAPTTKALADTAAFLKEQGKVDAVLPDYAPSVNARFVAQ